ncbi:hypothetical protein HNP40_002146 [Mycobacteroides chelonae]|nr:hypothetical protein [Mycobacteroides chelonae]
MPRKGASTDLKVPFEECSETGDAELRSSPDIKDLPKPPQSNQVLTVPGACSAPQAHA